MHVKGAENEGAETFCEKDAATACGFMRSDNAPNLREIESAVNFDSETECCM